MPRVACDEINVCGAELIARPGKLGAGCSEIAADGNPGEPTGICRQAAGGTCGNGDGPTGVLSVGGSERLGLFSFGAD